MKNFRSTKGFSMIEVLVTVLILSVGLLGLASLQIKSLRFNQSAHFYAVAAQQARDMADRMRSNINSVLAGDYNALAGLPGSVAKDCSLDTETCTPQEIQLFDLWEWNTANITLLPSGTGSVAIDPSGTVFSINVQWVDRDNVSSYSLQVQP